MWLLNAVTFRLEQLPEGPLLPPYAILSHTWGDDEVTHQDVRSTDPRERADVREKLGWHKIENTCRLACQYGLSHVWIDTCCMDQTSSAELQESINSMFRWYEQADICIALLSDVAEGEDVAAETSQFRKARWFTRGWTLQELLAPAEIDFYDASWRFLGTKTELRYLIAEITGIGLGYIGDYLGFPAMSSYERLSKASVAERLSWVAERETKRQEDLAYCLLGIFNINIAMLYGEGIKAFRRLQEEIMKVSGDSSILSWGLEESCCSWRLDESSILAPLPTHFKNCREVQSCIINGVVPPTFSIHQKGLQLKAATRVDPMYDKLIYVSLGCRLPVKDDGPPAATVVVLPLVSADTEPQNLDGGGPGENEYIRPVWCRPILVSEEFLDGFETRELFIRRHSEARGDLLGLPFKLEWQCSPTQAYSILGTYPPQPIGTRFRDIGESVKPSKGGKIRSLGRLLMLPRRSSSSLKGISDGQPGWSEKVEQGQRMVTIHIARRGIYLLVLDYRLTTIGETERAVWDHEVEFRLYYDGAFGFEALQQLASTQDFSHLRQVMRFRQGGEHSFFLGEQDLLHVHTEKLTYMRDMTSITLLVKREADGHAACEAEREKRKQAQRQPRTWTTRRTLRFI